MKWRVGANVGWFSSTLKLSGHDVDIHETSATATLDARTSDRLTLQVGLGAIVDGKLQVEGVTHDVLPGFVVAAAIAYRLVDGGGAVPFVLLSGSAGFGYARTRLEVGPTDTSSLTSVDVRVGAIVGWSIAGVVSPYLAARAFGGPVTWSLPGASVSGGDKYHYAFGAGISVRIGDRVDAYVEGVPLGEKRIGGGVGVSF